MLPAKFVSCGWAFRPGSCPDERALPSLATPAARPCRPHLTVAQGTQRAARCRTPKPRARHWLPASAGTTVRKSDGLGDRLRRGLAAGITEGATTVPSPLGDRACRFGGFHKAISLGHLSLLRASCPPPFGPAAPFATAPGGGVGQQSKVARATAAARSRSVQGNKARWPKSKANSRRKGAPNGDTPPNTQTLNTPQPPTPSTQTTNATAFPCHASRRSSPGSHASPACSSPPAQVSVPRAQ